MALNVIKQPEPKVQNLVTQLSTHPHNGKAVVAVNDLGEIFLDTRTSKQSFEVVESDLLKALRSLNKHIRKDAYYHLQCAGDSVSDFARASIDIFKRQPINKSIVKDVAMCHWL